MNSEELEQSLRTEFESYLKNVLADMRQEVAEFQKQFEAEFEKHKAQVDEAFQNFSARIGADLELDAGFTESVVEHLRLSRDEGARITAMAIAEAEELEKQKTSKTAESPAPVASYGEIREAINDISSKTTQSTILKSLVRHASQFTPRGAFFIIKNEHFVGWRVFGKDGETVDEQTVREILFPVEASTVLSEAVRSLAAVESAYGVYADDSVYLNKLEYGQPEQMFAVPLVVRGRSVAVLYADPGTQDGKVNINALETLVRVASMTVEILASSRSAQMPAETAEETAPTGGGLEASVKEETSENLQETAEPVVESESDAAESYQFAETQSAAEETAEETYSYAPAAEQEYSYDKATEQSADSLAAADYQTSFEGDTFSFKPSLETQAEPSELTAKITEETVSETPPAEEEEALQTEPAWSQSVETEDFYSNEPSVSYETPSHEAESPAYEISEPQTYETETAVAESEYAPSASSDYQFEANQSFEAPSAEFEAAPAQTFEAPSFEAESFAPSNGTSSYETVATENETAESVAVETAVEAPVTQPSRSRFSERNVDLPIEVSEDERRLHNDARRFARLLVSEIKLYNEQKVKEGRGANDLYERLREAIDRSREMYDKRVQPSVAAKFDYFHYELVNNLAEGDAAKLGASYPGSSV